MEKQNAIFLLFGRVIIVLSIIVNLIFAIWIQGQSGKLDDFLHQIGWGCFIFWLIVLTPIFVTSFRKTAYKNPSFWIITAIILSLFAYIVPLFIVIQQVTLG